MHAGFSCFGDKSFELLPPFGRVGLAPFLPVIRILLGGVQVMRRFDLAKLVNDANALFKGKQATVVAFNVSGNKAGHLMRRSLSRDFKLR